MWATYNLELELIRSANYHWAFLRYIPDPAYADWVVVAYVVVLM